MYLRILTVDSIEHAARGFYFGERSEIGKEKIIWNGRIRRMIRI